MIRIFIYDNFQLFLALPFFELIKVNFNHLFYYTNFSVLHIPNEETDEATFPHCIAYKSLRYFCPVQLHIEEAF